MFILVGLCVSVMVSVSVNVSVNVSVSAGKLVRPAMRAGGWMRAALVRVTSECKGTPPCQGIINIQHII